MEDQKSRARREFFDFFESQDPLRACFVKKATPKNQNSA
jgi:hypothetical protein